MHALRRFEAADEVPLTLLPGASCKGRTYMHDWIQLFMDKD